MTHYLGYEERARCYAISNELNKLNCIFYDASLKVKQVFVQNV